MARCIITGCRLVFPDEFKSLCGDLYVLENGSAYVFNGMRKDDRAKWEYAYPDVDKAEKQLILHRGADYFERHGIVTVAHDNRTELNETAKRYLGDR